MHSHLQRQRITVTEGIIEVVVWFVSGRSAVNLVVSQ